MGDVLFPHFPFFLDLVYIRYTCTLVTKVNLAEVVAQLQEKSFRIFDFESEVVAE
jgi:hypothetical protein